MCFSKLGRVNYSCHLLFFQYFKISVNSQLLFFSLRDNVLLMTIHLSQFSPAMNKGTKGRLNHTALKNVLKSHRFVPFFLQLSLSMLFMPS